MIEQRRDATQTHAGRRRGDAAPRRPPRWRRSSRPAPASRRSARRSWPPRATPPKQARTALLAQSPSRRRRRCERPRRRRSTKDRRRRGTGLDRAVGRLAVDIAERLPRGWTGRPCSAAFSIGCCAEIRAPAGAGAPGGARRTARARGGQRDAARAGRAGRAAAQRSAQAVRRRSPRSRFKADPALIAGLELRGPHLVRQQQLARRSRPRSSRSSTP